MTLSNVGSLIPKTPSSFFQREGVFDSLVALHKGRFGRIELEKKERLFSRVSRGLKLLQGFFFSIGAWRKTLLCGSGKVRVGTSFQDGRSCGGMPPILRAHFAHVCRDISPMFILPLGANGSPPSEA